VDTSRFANFPIYLAYTASLIGRMGIETEVLDCAAPVTSPDGMIKRLCESKPEICLVETSTPTIAQDLQNARRIKQEIGSKVILMGPHVSIADVNTLTENPFIDGIIRGEFEEAAAEACVRPWSEVFGLTYRDGKEIRRNPARQSLIDLSTLPFPAWEKFDLKHYDWVLLPSPAMLITATRGCPFHCSYCLWPQLMYGHVQRRRSPKSVVDEMEVLVNDFGVKGIRFDDDTFALDAKYVESICREIIERGLQERVVWSCFGHTSAPNEEAFRLMKKAGCVQIDFGVETGSEEVLKGLGKNTNVENARRTMAICRKMGIKTYGTYMIGFPEESREDILRTIDLALTLNTDFMQVSYVIPYPGTRLYELCRAKGYLPFPEQWEKYDGTQPVIINKIGAQELQKLYKLFWKKFFLRFRYFWYFFRKSTESARDFRKAVRSVRSFLLKIT